MSRPAQAPRRAPRAARLLLCSSALSALAPAACGPAPAPRAAPAPSAAASAGPPPTPWRHAAAWSRWPRLDTEPRPSRGHGLSARIELRVSPEAEPAYRALVAGGRMPTGAVVVQAHHLASGSRGPLYAMERREAGWEYSVVRPDGALAESGALERCERCHAEATADHLFGLPRVLAPR